jgi:hypothetical protein
MRGRAFCERRGADAVPWKARQAAAKQDAKASRGALDCSEAGNAQLEDWCAGTNQDDTRI